FGVDDDWEIQRKKFSKQARIGGIRWLLQADECVEEAPDSQIVMRFRLDTHVRQPASDAFILSQPANPSIRSFDGIEWIQGSCHEKEQSIVIEPLNVHSRRYQRHFDTGQE